MGSWVPVTPAKPTPARPEVESINKVSVDEEKFLGNFDAALNPKDGFEDDMNFTSFVELGDHGKTRWGGVNGSLFGRETWSTEENSRNQNRGAETVERLNIGSMQQLFVGVNGIDFTINLSSQGRDSGITDDGRFSSLNARSGIGCGANKQQNLKKRKRKNNGTESKTRPIIKTKKHRPKIFDVMKPKRQPKAQKKPKSEKTRKDTEKPKFEKKRKEVKEPRRLKSTKAPLDNFNPQTPAPSAPSRISSSIDSCRSVTSSEEHGGKAFDSCSGHAKPSCKRTLDYDLDVRQGASPRQEFSDKIAVPQYKFYTRRKKSFSKMDFNLNFEVQDFEFCAELRKIVWEVKTLKFRFEDFPITSKKMRKQRRKASAYPSFLETKKYLQEILPSVKQFSAAMMEPKSFRCLLALQPMLLSRKKRSKRLKKVAAVRGSDSNSSDHLLSFTSATESDNGTLPAKQIKCALPSSLVFPRRKRSQINTKRQAVPISTLDFGSNLNEIGIEKSPLIDLNTLPGAFEEVLGVDNQSSMTTVVESSKMEPQNTQIQECLPYQHYFCGGQICMSHYQGVTHKMQQQKIPFLALNPVSHHLEHKGLIDDLIKKLQHLSIDNECKQIVVCDQSSHGALIPSKRRTKKKGPPPPKVTRDADRILLITDGSESAEENYWKKEKEIFCGRVDMFIKCMHLIQGNRRFSRWKGSVVDSVIGVFLTQNVNDNMSSDAFMRLAARFPKHPIESNDDTQDVEDGIGFGLESVGSNTEIEGPMSDSQIQLMLIEKEHQLIGKEETANLTPKDMVSGFEVATLNRAASSKCEVSSSTLEGEVFNSKAEHVSDNNKNDGKKRTTSKLLKKKQEEEINWDDLRKEYATKAKDTTSCTEDSVDWQAVRHAGAEEIEKVLAKRGMSKMLARVIMLFLNRLVEDHGSIDLEWLRNVPPEKARAYLLRFERIGLKSLDCVRLLTLHHHAFPVDTNVGRIVVRLGWVPLQPLPDGVHLHLLNQYPMLNAIQEYLWPRLNALDQQTLYELHYQMITFGKVFCTKTRPRCDVCPMKGHCKHFASAASANLRLPSSQEEETDKMVHTANQDSNGHINLLGVSRFDDTFLLRHESQNCEPIIEIPQSPEPKSLATSDIDIEDLSWDSKDAEQDTNELFWDLRDVQLNNNNADDLKAVVVLASEAASFPARKLKSLCRLHTEHEVYELPDDHDLLARFRKREPGDPSHYLLAVWIADDATNSVDEQTDQTVPGTILIPCRTANRGRFALNGTYFQVNEVFADYETSENPIHVPRQLLWNLPKRIVYCASTGRSIFTDMSLREIHHCFWAGFICVRSFDRKSRYPYKLHRRFHVPKGGKNENNSKPKPRGAGSGSL